VPTAGYRGAHFATFPLSLIERPLLATCPERVCSVCGTPWKPVHAKPPVVACRCNAGWRPGLVLDPFMGAGTVAVAARKHHRDWLGIELNPAYRRLALQRLADG
jgi:DNA modification methylase